MNLIQRIQRGIQVGVKAFQTAPDFKRAEAIIEKRIQDGTLPTLDMKEKKDEHTSRLDIHNTTRDQAYYSAYGMLRSFVKRGLELQPYGTWERDSALAEMWREEPILAGAVYSMTAKMVSLRWTITGRRLVSKKFAEMFATAAHIDGYDWGGFLSSSAQDFYTTNRGVYWETPRDSSYGVLQDIGHIDALCCFQTGNRAGPMLYSSEATGQTIRFKFGEYRHFSSMISPREKNLGIGFCAVDRANRAAKLLMGLHDYDDEKLNNLPPEGIAAVTGLTLEEFMDAVKLWKSQREADKSLTFPQVLWLLGSQPNVDVKVDIKGFSSLPESFDRKTVVDQYVSTLALDFGVDAREFWPISSGSLGTASESEIQHQKARGKGPGEFISTTERHLNAELPDDAEYRYDTQDIEEDLNAAQIAKAWVDAFWPLYVGIPNPKTTTPPAGNMAFPEDGFGGPKPASKPGDKSGQQPGEPAGQRVDRIGKENGENPFNDNKQQLQTEQVVDKEQLLRLLADKGVLPDYFVNDKRIVIQDTEIHIKEGHDDDMTCFEYNKGVLKEVRLPPIVINSNIPADRPAVTEVIDAIPYEWKSIDEALRFLETKEAQIVDRERNIHGEPISVTEVDRGTRITSKTIKSELARWRSHPILSKYAPSEDEEKLLVSGLKK